MKTFIISIVLFCSASFADYLGSWDIDDYLTVMVPLHDSTGDLTAADGAVDIWVYEDDTDAQIVDEEMDAAFDSITGLYKEKFQLTAVAGFEAGKCYTVLVKCAIDGIDVAKTYIFQICAASDTEMVEGSDATDYIETRTLATANYFDFTTDTANATLVSTGLDDISVTQPGTDVSEYNFREYLMWTVCRWSNETVFDTDNDYLYVRNAADDGYISKQSLDETGNVQTIGAIEDGAAD